MIERFILGYLYDGGEEEGAEVYNTLGKAEQYFASMSLRANEGEFAYVYLTQVVIDSEASTSVATFLKKHVAVRPKVREYNKKDISKISKAKKPTWANFSTEMPYAPTVAQEELDGETFDLFEMFLEEIA